MSAALERAEQLFREGLVSDALEAFALAVQSPDAATRADGELGYGLALQALGRFGEAAVHLEAAAQTTDAAALPLAANRWVTGDVKAAEQALRGLEASAPALYGASALLGNLLFDTGRADEGRAVLERALAKAKDDAATTAALKVVLGTRLGGPKGAEHLRAAAAQSPQLALRALFELAQVLGRAGKTTEAQAALDDAAACAGKLEVEAEAALWSGDLEVMRAGIAEQAGQLAAAEAAWRAALGRFEGPRRRGQLGDALDGYAGFLVRRERYAAAVEALKAAARAHGPGEAAAASLGRLSALSMFQSPPNLVEAGAALQLAQSYLEKAHGADHPLLAPVLEQLSAWASAAGKAADAIDFAEQALELREVAHGPTSTALLTALVQIAGGLLKQGADAKAEPVLERARVLLTAGPVLPDVAAAVLLNLAELKERKGLPSEAAQLRQGAEDVLARGREG